jgi:steroid delta-isomerase-like uncharacterized protein
MRATTIAVACLVLLVESSLRQAVPATPAPDQKATQTSRSGKSLLQAFISAWNRHDAAAFDTLLTPDAIYEDIAWGFRGQGLEQIKGLMRDMIESEPDFDWRLTTVIESGPIVAAEWTWTATFTGDTPIGHVVRRRISGRGATVAVIGNGKIKHFTDYYDMVSYFPKAPES